MLTYLKQQRSALCKRSLQLCSTKLLSELSIQLSHVHLFLPSYPCSFYHRLHSKANKEDRMETSDRNEDIEMEKETKSPAKLKQMTPMMLQYFKLKEQHKDYMLMFRMGDFYEMFFDDAIKASELLDIALTKRGQHQGRDIPLSGIPHHALDNYLPKLVKNGISVAICEQIEKKKGTGGYKQLLKRDVTRVVTPGTLTEENMLDARENNYLTCLYFPPLNSIRNIKDIQDVVIGLSWTEISTGEFQITNTTFGTLKGDLMRLSPSEVLIPEMSESDYNTFTGLKFILRDFHTTVRGGDYFASETARNLLSEKFPTMDTSKFSSIELISSGALISYILETQKGNLPYLEPSTEFSFQKNYLSIDYATRSSLELVKTFSGEKKGSLLHTLDRTITAPGARLLAMFLKYPLTNTKIIEERLDAIEYFIGHLDKIEEIRYLFKRLGDMERSLQRLNLSRGSPRDLYSISNTMEETAKLQDLLLSCRVNGRALPAQIEHCVQVLAPDSCQQMITDIMNALLEDPKELPSGFGEGGFIRTGYSSQLDEYKKIQHNSNAIIKQLESSYRKQTGISTLKISETKLSGRYIDIPSSQMQKMANHKEFFHVQSLTNSVRYRTNELIELQTKMQSAKENAIEIELEIYNNLREMVTKHASQIRETAKAVASLDVFTSLALLARERNYRKPKVLHATEDMKLEIIGARHPTVELAQNESGIGTFVSNDCKMSAKKDRIMIITGPNMGGKSTYLRQNALVIIMAQCGFYVPSDKAEFTVVDKVFSRVGAMDNLAKDQSTFMVEMVETANILTQATSQSFVIMDEVGRGTATRDGLAIAWSIVEYIHSVLKCRCLFATHYHELTDIQAKWNDQAVGLFTSQVREGSNRSLQFLYKISPGITSKSFGVHVAQIAGVPRAVTDRAEQILKQLDEQQNKLHIQ